MAKEKGRRLMVRIDDELMKRIHKARKEAIAASPRAMHTMTVSDAVRYLLDMGLKQWEEAQQALEDMNNG